jgi:hypothetical protein
MHKFRVRFSGPDASYLIRSSAGCITNTSESEFSLHTADLRSAPPGDHRGAGDWWSTSRLSSSGMTLHTMCLRPIGTCHQRRPYRLCATVVQRPKPISLPSSLRPSRKVGSHRATPPSSSVTDSSHTAYTASPAAADSSSSEPAAAHMSVGTCRPEALPLRRQQHLCRRLRQRQAPPQEDSPWPR